MAEATIEKNADGKIVLSKAVRKQVMWRHQYLQGSWNYERMQNGGWCFSMIPAIKALYKDPEDQKAALKRHLEFYNTHPYVSAPVIGVVLAMEEERANGAPIGDVAIQGVKVGMMGPLAGVGDPVFWYTVRPILGALGASLALSGSIVGPLLFFIAWNIIRIAFLWYTQEAGYNLGTSITKDLSGGLLGRLTEGASILGMFIIGALVERWVSINFTPVVARIPQQAGAYIDWESLPAGADGIKQALTMYSSIGTTALDPVKTVTLHTSRCSGTSSIRCRLSKTRMSLSSTISITSTRTTRTSRTAASRRTVASATTTASSTSARRTLWSLRTS
jgi:mannose PTS system EIID component